MLCIWLINVFYTNIVCYHHCQHILPEKQVKKLLVAAPGKNPGWNQALGGQVNSPWKTSKKIPGQKIGKKAWIGFSLSTPWKTRRKAFLLEWPVISTSHGFHSGGCGSWVLTKAELLCCDPGTCGVTKQMVGSHHLVWIALKLWGGNKNPGQTCSQLLALAVTSRVIFEVAGIDVVALLWYSGWLAWTCSCCSWLA